MSAKLEEMADRLIALADKMLTALEQGDDSTYGRSDYQNLELLNKSLTIMIDRAGNKKPKSWTDELSAEDLEKEFD